MKVVILTFLIVFVCSDIKVHTPGRLAQQFPNHQIKHSFANFGKIPYGTMMAGRVFYFPTNPSGCSKFTKERLDPEGDPDKDFSPIVMVDRGNCSFVRKARNIQELGGALALIADFRGSRNPEEVIMIDDGTGDDIAIPTALISQDTGNLLKEEIKKTQSEPYSAVHTKEFVVLLVDFVLEKPDDRVEYEIWYVSGNKKAMDFITKMERYNKRLGKHALMTPHMCITSCHSCTNEQISRNCIKSEGENYCIPTGASSNLAGVDALRQGLLEICIYETHIKENNAEKWWEYMNVTYDCINSHHPTECLNEGITKVGMDFTKVQACLLREQEILKREGERYKDSEIIYNPAIIVNERVYRGILDPDHIFKTICHGFNVTPDVCFDDYDEKTQKRTGQSGSVSTGAIIALIVALVAINILLIYCYRVYDARSQKEAINMQINAAVSQYFALTDTKEKKPLNPNP